MGPRSLLLVALLAAAPVAAQMPQSNFTIVPYELASGEFDGPERGSGEDRRLVWQADVFAPAETWMRVHFSGVELGRRSTLVVTSHENGDLQSFDATTIEQWNLATGMFRGGAVTVQLYAAAGDRGLWVALSALTVGLPSPPSSGNEDTLCGGDNRGPSNDVRVGRISPAGCTGWAITNGAFLTAGHCIDFDPDRGGPLLPDGVPDLSGVLEFNVPASEPDGTWNPSLLEDQYAIDETSFDWQFDGEGQGLGKDWGTFRVFPNSTTLLLPHEAYGVLPIRVAANAPTLNSLMRVTGCGTDDTPAGSTGGNNAQNGTLQTATGLYLATVVAATGELYSSYTVDTEPGNSGSPVLRQGTDWAVAIHTNGGCTSTGGSNAGTSFISTALYNAINDYRGTNVRYLDGGHPFTGTQGNMFRPYSSFAFAVNALASGQQLSIVAGTYPVPAGTVLTKPMVIDAPVGSAVLQ